MLTRWVASSALILLSFLATACGPIRLGSAVPNDQLDPDWALLASGEFVKMSSHDIGGTASIYRAPNGAYVLRIAGITAPAEGGLQLVVTGNSRVIGRVALRAASGNQNYDLNPGIVVVTWNRVDIHSTATSQDYAQAILSTP